MAEPIKPEPKTAILKPETTCHNVSLFPIAEVNLPKRNQMWSLPHTFSLPRRRPQIQSALPVADRQEGWGWQARKERSARVNVSNLIAACINVSKESGGSFAQCCQPI
jgi:hypothetical protein